MQDDKQPNIQSPPEQQTPPPSTDDYYKQLRQGKQDFDPKTAEALLMQVNMEASRSHNITGQKEISVVSALLRPWLLFSPSAPSSARRIAVVLIFIVILVIASYLLPSFIN